MEISKRTRRFFDVARKVSENSSKGKFRHGAILVKHGVIINVSHNKDNYCSFGNRFRADDSRVATLHAELGAILNQPRDKTEGSDIYVVRINLAGEIRNSKPCPMCQEAMKFCGIKRAFYSIEDGKYEMMKL